MSDLKEMLSEAEYFNKMFRAKTYADAVEEFYGKYNNIFMEMNDRAEAAAETVSEKYIEEDPEAKKAVEGVKSIINRTGRDKDDSMAGPDRPALSEGMADIIGGIASGFINDIRDAYEGKGGKLPKGRYLMDLNIYMVMYVFPGIIATEREFSYYIAEMIGKKWPDTFSGHVLGCADYDTINSGFKRRFCYITTAVCESLGKEDDCEELSLLRSFRDGYMMTVPGGEEMVREYYDTAPRIVNVINALSDSEPVYRELYAEYIKPCIEMIKQGRLYDCMRHYRAMVRELLARW